jgi:flagellin-like protein
MNEILALLLMLLFIFVLAAIFNVVTYLFFLALELIGEGVRWLVRSK